MLHGDKIKTMPFFSFNLDFMFVYIWKERKRAKSATVGTEKNEENNIPESIYLPRKRFPTKHKHRQRQTHRKTERGRERKRKTNRSNEKDGHAECTKLKDSCAQTKRKYFFRIKAIFRFS